MVKQAEMQWTGQLFFLSLLKENGGIIYHKTRQGKLCSERLRGPCIHRGAGKVFCSRRGKTSSSSEVVLIRIVILVL